jgi:hypothetical protein
MADRRKGPAPGTRGEAANNAGERSPNHTKGAAPGFCLVRYKPPKGRALAIRLGATDSEMLAALSVAPASRFDLMKRRPRLGLSGPQIVERLRKRGLTIESEWLRGLDGRGKPTRFVRYHLRGAVQGVIHA